MWSVPYGFLDFLGKYFFVFVSVTHQSSKGDQHNSTAKH